MGAKFGLAREGFTLNIGGEGICSSPILVKTEVEGLTSRLEETRAGLAIFMAGSWVVKVAS